MSCRHCGYDDEEDEVPEGPEVDAAAELVKKVYGFGTGSGGNLHCVVDDGNVDCIDDPMEDPLPGSTPAQLKAEKACADALRNLDEAGRYAAINKAHEEMRRDGYPKPRARKAVP